MEGLQRSTTSFRRQGSSGLVWDDRFLSGELNKVQKRDSQEQEKTDTTSVEVKASRAAGSIGVTVERSRSNGGGRGYRTGKVSPAIEPPSPRVSACGFCGVFGKPAKKRRAKTGKRRSR